MHQRKAAMADAADAFVMLPGGYGTFDEFFEVVTWTQLGIHAKPCGILDVAGYFAPLTAMLDAAASQGFVTRVHRDLVITAADPDTLLDRLSAWTPVFASKWIDPSLQPRVHRLGLERQHAEHALMDTPQRLAGRHPVQGLKAE
jgi:predicted Rossmann-fold nucleotide-binding protein